jgi:hypothetical protein
MNEYIGGKLTNITNDQTTYLGGLLIIDMNNKNAVARNVSTGSLGAPRVAGGMIYAPRFGKTVNGSLVTFGGMRSKNASINTFRNGALVGISFWRFRNAW